MRGILDQRERMNLPAGMSELDLINYSPVLYELYRNEGQGFDNDAFRYDPVVSTGMLASDYELAKGLAWVNYLTPESQGAINPGDNLIVPVQTFDNYKNLPPWEKKLSHEVSYTGKNVESKYSANLLNLQASQVGMKNNFVGDFSYYFDNESRLLGTDRLVADTPISTPRPKPVFSITPTPIIIPRPMTPISIRPVVDVVDVVIPKPSFSTIATQVSTTPGLVVTTTPVSPVSSSSGSSLVSGGGGGVDMSGDMSGGASSDSEINDNGTDVSGTDARTTGSDTPPDNTSSSSSNGSSNKKAIIKNECKIDYIPVIIGLIILGIIGYAVAKQKKKDVKVFGITGAVIGAILGYAYAKHQCNPIEALSKIGIKSKSESNYYGGR